MTRWFVSVSLTIGVVLALLATGRLAVAEEPADDATAGPPNIEAAAVTYARPAYPLGFAAGIAYTGAPARAYRRGPLSASVGVYIGPRSIYAGVLAPWGSLPARYYAASFPLPYVVTPYRARLDSSLRSGTTPYRAQPGSQVEETPPLGGEWPVEDPFKPEGIPPAARPEPIPTPQPIDRPGPGGASHSGLTPEVVVPEVKPTRPASRPVPPRRSESGPREF
jgi:hypothetical protein